MEKIRVGIFGLNRGAAHIPGFLGNNADIVAVCDQRENLLESARKKLGDGVGYYTSFDEFIEHGCRSAGQLLQRAHSLCHPLPGEEHSRSGRVHRLFHHG